MQPEVLFLTTAKLDIASITSWNIHRKTVCVCVFMSVRSNTGINLWWLHIWTKVITMWDEGFHLYPGSEWNAAQADGNAGKQKQMRIDEVAEVSGGDLKCSKHLASLWLCTGEAGLRVDFLKSHTCAACAAALQTFTGSCSPFHSSVTFLPPFLSL